LPRLPHRAHAELVLAARGQARLPRARRPLSRGHRGRAAPARASGATGRGLVGGQAFRLRRREDAGRHGAQGRRQSARHAGLRRRALTPSLGLRQGAAKKRPHPCKLASAASGRISGAVAVGRPAHPRAGKPVAQRGAHIADPSIPDSRVGRDASPVEQGRVRMDAKYVGIDVSKDRLDVHVRPTGEAFAVARDGEGLAALVERLRLIAPQLVAVEATGGFEMTVAGAIGGAGLPLAVVNPAQVRHYAQALGRRAKTDAIDAEVIARFAEATRPEPRPLPDEATQALAELVTRRRQIIAMMVAERQRATRLPKRLKRSCERVVRVLEQELAALDQDIDTTVRGSPAW